MLYSGDFDYFREILRYLPWINIGRFNVFGDLMIPDKYLSEPRYRWQEQSRTISMKGVSGMLVVGNGGDVKLLRSGDIPRYYSAHGVVNGEGEKKDNLFTPKAPEWEAKQHEGAFKPSWAVEIEVPSRIWMDYCGRNRHCQRPVLEENDIIWGQPVDPAKELASWKSEDIQSLQWARWRKTGGTFCRLLQETPFGATVKPETEGRYYENTSLNRQKKQEERNKRH